MKSKNLSSVDSEESSRSICRQCIGTTITKEQLDYDFFTLELTKDQVAVKYNCSRSLISNIMKKLGVKLREYKEYNLLIDTLKQDLDSGLTITQMTKKYACSYSTIHKYLQKHGIVLKLYPNKVDIPYEELVNDLLKEGLSTKQLALKYQTSVTTINSYIRKYNIQRDLEISCNRSFKARKFMIEDRKLSERQESILIGSLLGDGHMSIRDSYKTAFLQCGHCTAQKEYLEWKALELEPFISDRGIYKMTSKEAYMFDTIHYKAFNKFYNLFYSNGKKLIPNNIIDYLTELTLVIWFGDDGWSDNKIKTSGLATCSFTDDENNLLLSGFKTKWDIVGTIGYIKSILYNKSYPILLFNKDNRVKLHEIVDPLLHPCFEYKKLPGNYSASETIRKALLLGDEDIVTELISDDKIQIEIS